MNASFSRRLGVFVVLGLIGIYSWNVLAAVGAAGGPAFTIAAAYGREPVWWERLLIENGYPLAILYALLTIPTWIASVLARSNTWYAGGMIGAALGLFVGRLLSSFSIAIVGALFLGIAGCVFDHHISLHYRQRLEENRHPSWWAGGPHGGPFRKRANGAL